jgi:hypothetical protein
VSGIVAAALACNCSSSSGGGAGGSGGVCDDYFNIFTGRACGLVTLPDSELARLQPRFEKECAASLGLPGVTFTSANIEACLQAVKAANCNIEAADHIDSCKSTPGTLAANTPCLASDQCQSGNCIYPQIFGEGGGIVGQAPCGKCSAAAQLGQSCANAIGADGGTGVQVDCVSGTACDSTSRTCVTISSGGVGAPCGSGTQVCNQGLYCTFKPGTAMSTCQQPIAQGMPCTGYDCASGLTCNASTMTCVPQGQAGAACTQSGDCARGLGCPQATKVCTSITYASAGQPCDGDAALCLVGFCPFPTPLADAGTVKVCPNVIADGQPCTVTGATCDTFSSCISGVCTILGTQTCM